ncbi:probable deoxynucleotidyltransferase terminal-interacting protein 2 at C-terminar half [Coccomyxa sp. Obi]|nr:probable deoxynucleotidyltransferase terminal-interacting protein 2 at C-terminar half [Coccomyxa sp. Obi]
MVSLRSGSTTDNKDIGGTAEVTSTRRSRRTAVKQDSRLAETESNTADQARSSTVTAKKGARGRSKALASIAEAPHSGVPTGSQDSADSDMVPAPKPKPVAARLPALTSGQSLDTPAKHTRSRSRLQEPILVAQNLSDAVKDAEGAGTSARNSHKAAELTTPALGPDSKAASSDKGQSDNNGEASSADSESEEAAPVLGQVAAGNDALSGGEQGSDDDAASSAESESDGSEAVGKGVRSAARSASAAESHEEESSSGWSSGEEGEEGEEQINELAQSMLAALHSIDGGRASGSGVRSDTQRTHVSLGAISSDGKASDLAMDDVEELRWEPALKLPSPVAAGEAVSGASLVPNAMQSLGNKLMAPPADLRRQAREAKKAAPDTAGKAWFDLPAQQITPEVKRDLRLIRLRGAMDPKRFYKSLDQTKFPKYFQLGTVVEGAADFYAGRMTRKERKGTLTEEILADPDIAATRAKRYGALQEERGRWARKKKRPTTNERKKVAKRPRH